MIFRVTEHSELFLFFFPETSTLTAAAGLPFPELLAEQFPVHLCRDTIVLNQCVESVSGLDQT